MKLRLDPPAFPCHVSAEAEALADWYDAHPAVRRLWAIGDARVLSVLLTLEPTVDNDDTYPAWYACNHRWAREIQSLTTRQVQLGMLDEPTIDEFEVDVEGELVAAISWRDPTYYWAAD